MGYNFNIIIIIIIIKLIK